MNYQWLNHSFFKWLKDGYSAWKFKLWGKKEERVFESSNEINEYKEEEKMDGVYEKKVQTKDVLELLSKFSTEELTEALRLKEDVQVVATNEDAHELGMDLLVVKKHVLVINNCKPQLVENRKRIMEAEKLWYNGGSSTT